MIVKIKAFANFKEILGSERDLDVRDGATIGDVLSSLAATNRAFREAAFESSGRLRDYVVLMKNRRRLASSEGLTSVLQEGDEVAIFPPVAGG
jgi:molybdopterin synthase sulfur carrier subunit